MFRGLSRQFLLFATACLALFLTASAALADTTTSQSTATSSASKPAPVCDWGKRIWGQPQSFHAGGTDGYYIWCARQPGDQDDPFLTLRTTDSAGKFHYSGVLRTNGKFVDVKRVRDEADDHVDVSADGKTLRFSFVTYEGIDGFDFHVQGGSKVSYRLERDGTRIDPANIFLGEDSVHPAHNPFAIHRLRDHVRKPAGATRTTTTATATAS